MWAFLAMAAPAVCDPALPRPRVYTYPLPTEFHTPRIGWRDVQGFFRRLRSSPYAETDGNCADFFAINHFAGANESLLLRMFHHIVTAYPYWNRTADRGLARHLLYLPCDHGPSDCSYERPMHLERKEVLNQLGINPVARRRNTIFLVLNGLEDRRTVGSRTTCRCCFSPGLDIRLPTPHHHLCGPLCGYREAELRTHSVWALARAEQEEALRGRRPVRFFWAGSARRPNDARHELLRHHGRREGWRVLSLAKVKTGRHPGGLPGLPPPTATRPFIPREMSQADFCGSPPGWDGGDSDRYLPAILFGCIPVFFSTREARPLEELTDMRWDQISVRIDLQDIAQLHERLGKFTDDQVVAMRLAMRDAWPRLLFSSYSKRPLLHTKNGSADAFEGIMQVLRQRLRRQPGVSGGVPAHLRRDVA